MEDSSIFQSGNNFNLYNCGPKNLDYEKAAQLRDEIKRFESDLSAIAK